MVFLLSLTKSFFLVVLGITHIFGVSMGNNILIVLGVVMGLFVILSIFTKATVKRRTESMGREIQQYLQAPYRKYKGEGLFFR